jgi:putative heme transporter
MTTKTWLRWLAIALVLAAIGYTAMDLIAQVSWLRVWNSIGTVTWWQVLALFGLLVVKQTLNASPLSFFLPGLSLFRATVNDQASTLVQMVAPPPSDLVLRLRIFTSWGIDPTRGLAAAMMNVLSFYTNRLLVPTFGLLLLIAAGSVEVLDLLIALVALALGVTLIVIMRLGVRDREAAWKLGRWIGRLVHRLRSSVDPESWGERSRDFRDHVADRFSYALPRSLGMLLAMTLVDAGLLALALRFVGVPARPLPVLVVVGGFLVWFPLTIFPLSGLGLLDAVLVGVYTATAGEGFEPKIVAALTVYRLVSIGGTLVLGVFASVVWRWTLRHSTVSDDPPGRTVGQE